MYTETFKEAKVQKLLVPGGPKARELAQELGIGESTLSGWKKAYSIGMSKETDKKRPQDWTAEERLEALLNTSKLSEEELGIYLRREGLHKSQLEQWKAEFLQGQKMLPKGRKKRGLVSEEKRRIKDLERELRRKDKALAEATALLILKKKIDLIWGKAGDEEPP